MSYRIVVSATQFWVAKKNNSSQCPVAHALRAGGLKYPVVTVDEIRGTDVAEGLRYAWKTPAKVQEIIRRVDSGDKSPLAKDVTFVLDAKRAIEIREKAEHKRGAVKRTRRGKNPAPRIGATNRTDRPLR